MQAETQKKVKTSQEAFKTIIFILKNIAPAELAQSVLSRIVGILGCRVDKQDKL